MLQDVADVWFHELPEFVIHGLHQDTELRRIKSRTVKGDGKPIVANVRLNVIDYILTVHSMNEPWEMLS